MTVASPVESSDVVVPIQSRRRERALLFQQLQHAVPALLLFPDGLQRLAGEPHGLAMGLLHGPIKAKQTRRRALRITEDGLTIAGRFFTRFSAAWRDIARIDLDATEARIVTTDGRERRINLADSRNAPALREALLVARARQTRALGAPPESPQERHDAHTD